MKSHFENIWEMMKKNTLSKVIEEIEEFEKDPGNFRRIQCIENINKNTRNLVKLPKC